LPFIPLKALDSMQ